jgi:hypothetical protein
LYYEIVGTNYSGGQNPILVSLPAYVGHNYRVYVYCNNGNVAYGMRDLTTNIAIIPINVSFTTEDSNPQESVDYIVERPIGANNLANFGTAHIWDNKYEPVGGQTTGLSDNGGLFKVSMHNLWYDLAASSWLDPSGTDPSSFQVYWYNAY